MVYGEGFSVADDIDAHELTHAVTQFSANLFNYTQSGALNESFSDIFGETVDLTNAGGTDTPAVRWLLGEDVPGIGAIRNMMNPNAFGDPGKVSDSEFRCVLFNDDQGGVHSNSGVPNHAYALMVDGGTFNGKTVTGMGLTKAGKIQYRTLTSYLTSGSNFLDNYRSLQQSCNDLIGIAGITAADCGAVKDALDAVEMPQAICAIPGEPVLCPAGQTLTDLFFDGLEAGGGNFVTQTAQGSNSWSLRNLFAKTGVFHLDNTPQTPGVTDSSAAMNLSVPIPAGGARMQFSHVWEFERFTSTFFDGAVVEFSTNGGASWSDAGSLIVAGAPYNGTISSSSGNPLGGRAAFVGESFGYTATQLDLTSLAGQNARFRFRFGADSDVASFGSEVDDVHMYQCGSPPPPPPPPPPVTPATGARPVATCQARTCGVRLTCQDPSTACTSQVDLTVPASALKLGRDQSLSAKARKRVTFASGVANIPPGQTDTVKLQLTKKGRKFVKQKKVKKFKGRLEVRNVSGVIVSNTAITIKKR